MSATTKKAILFAAALLVASAADIDNTEKKIMLPGAAKCTDGTQAAYYFSASPSGLNKWIVEIEGGGADVRGC